jgi:Rrf2 family protein
MRLRFSRTADYGLRAALEIAGSSDGELVPRHVIARVTDAPASVLAQALAPLVRAGVLAARAGPRGGYRLARPADQLSIYDIVVAIDGAEHEERCVLHESVCSWTGACPFHSFLIAAQERFLDSLRATSLADVIRNGAPVPAANPRGTAA